MKFLGVDTKKIENFSVCLSKKSEMDYQTAKKLRTEWSDPNVYHPLALLHTAKLVVLSGLVTEHFCLGFDEDTATGIRRHIIPHLSRPIVSPVS